MFSASTILLLRVERIFFKQTYCMLSVKAHFHSGKFSTERKFCEMWLADTNFTLEKNCKVENFQLLKMTFPENFLSVEIFLEWKWALKRSRK
jgi:hypothetical protein